MIRILIVEDEPIIAKGIQAIISKYSAYMVVALASNGEEGIRMIKKHQPDIVLTDIEMPQMTGIEMIEKVRQQGSTCEVIFITAFRDFRYAKAALTLGVNHYIVKPIDEAELICAIEQVSGKLTHNTKTQQLLLKEELNRYLTTGELHSLHYITWHQSVGNWSLFFLKKTEATHTTSTADRYWQPYFQVFRQAIPFGETDISCFYLLDGFQTTDWQEEEKALKQLHGDWLIFQSKPFTKITEVYQALGRLQRIRQEVFFKDLPQEPLQFPDIRKQSHEIEALLIGDKPLTVTLLQKVNDLIYSLAVLYQHDITTFFTQFSQKMERLLFLLEEEKTSPIKTDLLRHWLLQKNYRDLLASVENDLQSQIAQPTASTKTYPPNVTTLMNYIQAHFKTDISLNELAELVGMNQTYVSSYFKRHTGESFKSFQTRLRVQEAQRLLKETDKKIFEIADEIGYVGTHHFNSVFSQLTGITPTEYRNLQ